MSSAAGDIISNCLLHPETAEDDGNAGITRVPGTGVVKVESPGDGDDEDDVVVRLLVAGGGVCVGLA